MSPASARTRASASRVSRAARRELERRGQIACDELPEELETDGDRDQVLLHAVVERTLDPAPVGAGGGCKARSRGAELVGFGHTG